VTDVTVVKPSFYVLFCLLKQNLMSARTIKNVGNIFFKVKGLPRKKNKILKKDCQNT